MFTRTPASSRLPRLAGIAALALCTSGLACGAHAEAASKAISVNVDEASILRLDQPVSQVIVGNPSIADVSVRSDRMLVLTGKSYGVTNLIVLDNSNAEIMNASIAVTSDNRRFVTVYKGSQKNSYTCNPVCQQTLRIGDSEATFDPVAKQVQQKQAIANSAAEGGQGPQ